MSNILEKLRGGDRRSIGRANEVAGEIEENPALFASVFKGITDSDALIRMRSADIVEKVTRNNPQLLAGYTQQVISILAETEQQEVCWHLAQIAERLYYNASEEKQIITLLKNCLLHKSRIVQVSAMESLVGLAERNSAIKQDIAKTIQQQMIDGSPAVKARGRKLMQRIERYEDKKI